MFKFVKKVFTFGVVSSTILWSSAVATLVPTMANAAVCPTLVSGDMIKVVGHPAIYAVNNDGKVLYFPSGDEFKSWNINESYGGYISITQECFDSLAVPSVYPGAVNYRPGTYVVKRPSSDQLYVVLPGNKLSVITPAAATGLYGAYTVKTVQDAFWPHYVNRGADIITAVPHEGMLVSKGGVTYYVGAGSVLQEVTAAGMTANRFKTKFVHVVTDTMVSGFTVGTPITSAVSALTDRVQSGGVVVTTPPVVTVGGALTVSLAADSPAGNYLASGTALNPVLKLALTAGSTDTTVTSLKFRKTGFYANTNITGADVIDSAGVRHGNVVSTLTADSDVLLNFANNPIVVKAGTSEKVTLRVNLKAGDHTGVVAFTLLAAASVGSNGTVGGSFPVTGNTFNVQDGSGSIAGITISPQPVWPSGNTLNADGVNEQELAKFMLQETTSRESVTLKKFTVYNNGTAADTDLLDVQLVDQAGAVLATSQVSNKTVTFDLGANGLLIDKGQTKYLTIRAKLVNGAARTIQFVVYNDYDVELLGTTSNALLLASATASAGNSGGLAAYPIGNATDYNKVTIGSGSLTFNKDSSSPSSAVMPGANNVVLAKYFIKANGEDMELRKVTLAVAQGSTTALAGTVYVKVDGSTVYSVSASSVSTSTGSPDTLSLSTYPILKAGVTSYITVEANISTNASSSVDSYKVYVRPSEVKRLTTNDITSATSVVPANAVAGNLIAVQGTILGITNLATPMAQNLVAGTTNFELAKVELNAGQSGEDIRINSIIFNDGGTGTYTDLGNFAVYVAGQQVQTNANTAALNNITDRDVSFNFTNPILVTRTTPVVVSFRGDVLTGTSGTHKFLVHVASDVVAYGKTSGNIATVSAPTGNGQIMTLTSGGSVSLSLVSGSGAAPSNNQVVTVGTTNLPVFAIKLTAQNEAVKLQSLEVRASSTGAGSGVTSTDLVNVSVYKDAGLTPVLQVGQMSCNLNICDYTWTSNDNLLNDPIQPGTPVTLYFKADIGAAGNAVAGDAFKFYINSTSSIGLKGAFSGSSANVTGSAVSGGVTYITPWNVVIEADTPSYGSTVSKSLGGNSVLGTFKITNKGSGQVTITGVKLRDNGNHTGTSTYSLTYSTDGSNDYTTDTATTTAVDESSRVLDFGTTSFTINGNSYRYIAVVLKSNTGMVTGDTYSFAVAALGDVTYNLTEQAFGYDNNGDGVIDTSNVGSVNLLVDGKPSLGTYQKSAT